jgi:hypothetical protein
MSKKADYRLRTEFYVKGFAFGWAAYSKLLKAQGGKCAICQQPPKGIRLAVDHSHLSGAIRGLLCYRCNRGYGLFHDESVVRLERAAEYLRNPPATKVFGKPLYTAPGRLGTKKRRALIRKMMEE